MSATDSEAIQNALRLDEVCTRFEVALKAGESPAIEEFLKGEAGSVRRRQLRELLHLEVEYAKNPPKVVDYVARFPDDARIVREVLDSSESSKESGPPEMCGDFELRSEIGRGAMGVVYEGFDVRLRRRVAVKMFVGNRQYSVRDRSANTPSSPAGGASTSEARLEGHLLEARVVAGLDHPGIVPVYDIGMSAEGTPFAVSKLIEGGDLSAFITRAAPNEAESARIVAEISDALDHAHQSGLVHRDIKPGNILLSQDGTPYLSDFGLALREEDAGHGARFVGTPAYMSPEQARGEGHRVDGRSDIFSLGAVFYELLTGVRPFRATTREALLDQIVRETVTPPRSIVAGVSEELERICLRALAKRAADRYPSASAMAHDLRLHLSSPEDSIHRRNRSDVGSKKGSEQGVEPRAAVVPRGLRSFESSDAEFFLDLLPGPYDRDGMPRDVRDWKHRLESTTREESPSVCVIYGPSGCGKSSLMKAGLIPHLSSHVRTVYTECVADGSEDLLLRHLWESSDEIPAGLDLSETIASLRRGRDSGEIKKHVLVLDQFEQWLQNWDGQPDARLIAGLRQCDGVSVQCVLIVRDDFWLALSRFLRALEAPITEGKNCFLADLFDTQHARWVLGEFGRAYGALPDSGDLGSSERAFIERAVDELATDRRVISVRLALFAEMMKGRAWTPKSLAEVGGAEGLGIRFLEETLGERSAPAEHREHIPAIRRCLGALLPTAGTDLKGHRRTYAQLLAVSGYGTDTERFEAILAIMDARLRLITPAEAEGDRGKTTAFQLTHDYLVPSIREWLTRKQRETYRGRAALKLDDRSSLWSGKREPRLLPSVFEWLQIRVLTRKTEWSDVQRSMMRFAGRRHGARAVLGVVVVAAIAIMAVSWQRSIKEQQAIATARDLVERLRVAELRHAPAIIEGLDEVREYAEPMLRKERHAPETAERSRLVYSLALLPYDEVEVDFLHQHLFSADAMVMPGLVDALRPWARSLIPATLARAFDSDATPSSRLRAACALAAFDPEELKRILADPKHKLGDVVVNELLRSVRENAADYAPFSKLMAPVGQELGSRLIGVFADMARRDSERTLAASLVTEYAGDNTDLIIDVLMDSDMERFPVFFMRLVEEPELSASRLAKVLRAGPLPDESMAAKRRANAAMALLRLGQPEAIWELMAHGKDPGVRSFLIDRIGQCMIDPAILIARLEVEPDPSARHALLLGLGGFPASYFDGTALGKRLAKGLRRAAESVHSGEHASAVWLADRLGVKVGGKQPKANSESGWFRDQVGQTMIALPAQKFHMGSTRSEAGRQPDEERKLVRIRRPFAIASTEVTLALYRRFDPGFTHSEMVRSPTQDCPAIGVTWFEAAAFCNWLSEREGIPRTQWCYEPDPKGPSGAMREVRNATAKLGYRLPLEAEWELAARSGTTTARYYGDTDQLIECYAWCVRNADEMAWPVATKKPNDLGLFDILGNAMEWCHDKYSGPASISENAVSVGIGVERVLRGGSFYNQPRLLRSADRVRQLPSYRSESIGFRPARTLDR